MKVRRHTGLLINRRILLPITPSIIHPRAKRSHLQVRPTSTSSIIPYFIPSTACSPQTVNYPRTESHHRRGKLTLNRKARFLPQPHFFENNSKSRYDAPHGVKMKPFYSPAASRLAFLSGLSAHGVLLSPPGIWRTSSMKRRRSGGALKHRVIGKRVEERF